MDRDGRRRDRGHDAARRLRRTGSRHDRDQGGREDPAVEHGAQRPLRTAGARHRAADAAGDPPNGTADHRRVPARRRTGRREDAEQDGRLGQVPGQDAPAADRDGRDSVDRADRDGQCAAQEHHALQDRDHDYDRDKEVDVERFRQLLERIDRKLPFAEPSHLAEDGRSIRLLDASGGNLRSLAHVLAEAAEVAIRRDATLISDEDFHEACERMETHLECQFNPFE